MEGGSKTMELPEGFVLDQAPQQQQQASNNGLPEGFVLDASPTSGPEQPVSAEVQAHNDSLQSFEGFDFFGSERVAPAARGTLKGATFGFDDEIVGGIKGAFNPNVSIGEAISEERQGDAAAREQAPISFGVGEAVGAIATLPKTIAAAGVKGAIGTGAAIGAGNAEGGLIERGKGAAIGAGLGAAGFGAGKHLIAPAANFAGRKVASTVRTAIEKVTQGRKSSLTKPQRRAHARFRQIIDKSGETSEEFIAKLDRAQEVGLDDDFIFELAGSQGKQAAEGLAVRGGAAAKEGIERVRARQTMQQFKVSEELTKAFGSDGGDVLAQSKAIQKSKKAAAPLYDKFRSLKGQPVQDVMAVLGDDFDAVFTQAARSAERRTGTKIANDGTISPDVLHRMKVALSERTQTAIRSGDATAQGDNSALSGRFVDFIDERYPEIYKAARQAYAGPAAQQEAMDFGESIIRSTSTRRNPEALAEQVNKMSEDQLASFRIGVARAIRSEMAKGNTGKIAGQDFGDPANLIKRFFNNTEKQEAVRAAFGNDKQFAHFARKMIRLDDQAENFRQVNVTRSGSQTASRQGAAEKVEQIVEGAADAFVSDAGKIRGVAKLIKKFTADPETEEALATLLFSKATDQRKSIIQNLNRLSKDQRDREISKLLGSQATKATTVGSAQRSGAL